MPIDGCPFTFHELVEQKLPEDMARMRAAMSVPHPMEMFGQRGIGPKTIMRRLGLAEDFVGCYLLLDGDRPLYVGISRGVIQRLLQHVKGRTHYDASLAYRIASDNRPHNLKRSVVMQDLEFHAEFERAKDYLRSLRVAFVSIEDDIELYLFEVYCAMELATCKWNTFRTH
jgi:hypothetical protein